MCGLSILSYKTLVGTALAAVRLLPLSDNAGDRKGRPYEGKFSPIHIQKNSTREPPSQVLSAVLLQDGNKNPYILPVQCRCTDIALIMPFSRNTSADRCFPYSPTAERLHLLPFRHLLPQRILSRPSILYKYSTSRLHCV